MNRETNRWTNREKNEQTDRQTDGHNCGGLSVIRAKDVEPE